MIFISHKAEALQGLQAAKERALELIGQQAQNYATLQLYPGHGVDTGRLRGSIDHAQVDKDTEAIGTNVEYAPYVELGHHTPSGRFVPPIEFLRPAVMNHIPEYRDIAEEMLRNA